MAKELWSRLAKSLNSWSATRVMIRMNFEDGLGSKALNLWPRIVRIDENPSFRMGEHCGDTGVAGRLSVL